MSKAFALANFRFGYLISSKDNVQFINRIRNPKNISTITQTAAVAAFEDVEYMWNYVHEVTLGKEYFVSEMERFARIQICNSYGNFVLLKFESYEEKIALLQYLAAHNIFVRDTMQSPIVRNCFRVTCGTKQQMEYVVNAFNDFYAH